MGLREEGLRAFGSWEPLAHRIRSGGAAERVQDAYDWEHTEEFIRGLKERGFNLFITHFSKGWRPPLNSAELSRLLPWTADGIFEQNLYCEWSRVSPLAPPGHSERSEERPRSRVADRGQCANRSPCGACRFLRKRGQFTP